MSVEDAVVRNLLAPTLQRDALAVEALATVLGPEALDADALGHLLRKHVTVSDPRELRLREGFDRVLAAYSRLEVACFCRVARPPLPPPIHEGALALLSTQAVRRYYAEIYPLPLVVRLATRLEGGEGPVVSVDDAPAAARLFSRFVTIDRSLSDPSLAVFLKMLDDFVWADGACLPALLELARDPERFAASLGRIERRTTLDAGATGLRAFFDFARRLSELIERARSIPDLGETFRLHHVYWLVQLRGKTGAQLASLVTAVEGWGPDARQQTQELRQVLDGLFRSGSGG